MDTLNVRWHGRGGQGCFTVARLLGVAATLEGLYALAFPAFGPERRGAPVAGFTKISTAPVRDRSEIRVPDILVVLDPTLLGPVILQGLVPSSMMLVNAPDSLELPEVDCHVKRFDASMMAHEYLGRGVANTAMLGALVGLTKCVGLDAGRLAIYQELKTNIREQNIRLFDAAFQRFAHVA